LAIDTQRRDIARCSTERMIQEYGFDREIVPTLGTEAGIVVWQEHPQTRQRAGTMVVAQLTGTATSTATKDADVTQVRETAAATEFTAFRSAAASAQTGPAGLSEQATTSANAAVAAVCLSKDSAAGTRSSTDAANTGARGTGGIASAIAPAVTRDSIAG
jgi:hypothetical protein